MSRTTVQEAGRRSGAGRPREKRVRAFGHGNPTPDRGPTEETTTGGKA